MPGLFIQQQAEALVNYCRVTVLYVHPVRDFKQKYETVISEESGVHVIRVFYRVPSSGLSLFIAPAKISGFFGAMKKGMKVWGNEKIDLVHVHVLTRCGVIGYLVSAWKKIPFIVTEHWSRYFPENNTYRGFFRKMVTRFIVGKASGMIAVSGILKEAMLRHGLENPRFKVIPNAVNTENFLIDKESRSSSGSVKKIIHVSCFEDKSKNISGFLRVIKKISSKRRDFTVVFIGEGPDRKDMENYASGLGLDAGLVEFPGVRPHKELSRDLNNAGFLVLSSHYETFGIVIIEAMACGLPVVSTATGIAPDVIKPGTGLLVPPGDEPALQDAVEHMLDDCWTYDKEFIRNSIISRFGSRQIAANINSFYNEVLKP